MNRIEQTCVLPTGIGLGYATCMYRHPHIFSPWDTHYTMQQLSRSCAISKVFTSVTGPGKADLIYAKYTRLYYGTYLVFWMCYSQSVNFI